MAVCTAVAIPDEKTLRDEIYRMSASSGAARSGGLFAPWHLRWQVIFDLLEMRHDGITEATLEAVRQHSDGEPRGGGHLHKYDDGQLEEAWAAVAAFCADGHWPEGDVALIGTPAPVSA